MTTSEPKEKAFFDDDVMPFSVRSLVCGQEAHHASHGNIDKGHYNRNHDRSGVYALPAEADTKAFLRESMDAATRASVAVESAEKQSHTTGTFVVYDPSAYTINILSRGDSPVFLLFSEGRRHRMLRISSNADEGVQSEGGKMQSMIPGDGYREYLDLFMERKPPHKAAYSFTPHPDHPKKPFHTGDNAKHGTIRLDRLIPVACKHFGMSKRKVRVSMVVASDGMMNLVENEVTGTQLPQFVDHMALSKRNVAKAVVESAIDAKSKDNVSVIALPHISPAPESAEKIALAVCDGMKSEGYLHAQAALDAFSATVLKYNGRAVSESRAEGMDAPSPPPDFRARFAAAARSGVRSNGVG